MSEENVKNIFFIGEDEDGSLVSFLKTLNLEVHTEFSDEIKYFAIVCCNPIQAFETIDELFSASQEDIPLVAFGGLENVEEFISFNGKAIFNLDWIQDEHGKKIIKEFFENVLSSIHLDEEYQNEFSEYKNLSLNSHIKSGHYADIVAKYAFEGDFNLIGIRNFYFNIVYYISYLKQAGIAGFPIDIEYCKNESQFILRIICGVRNFVTDYIYNSFKSGNSLDPLDYLLSYSLDYTDFFEITYLEDSQKVVFTGLWNPAVKITEEGAENTKHNYLSIKGMKSVAQLQKIALDALKNFDASLESVSEEEVNDLITKILPGSEISPIQMAQVEISKQKVQVKSDPNGEDDFLAGSDVLGEGEEKERVSGDGPKDQDVLNVPGFFEEEELSRKVAGSEEDDDEELHKISAADKEKEISQRLSSTQDKDDQYFQKVSDFQEDTDESFNVSQNQDPVDNQVKNISNWSEDEEMLFKKIVANNLDEDEYLAKIKEYNIDEEDFARKAKELNVDKENLIRDEISKNIDIAEIQELLASEKLDPEKIKKVIAQEELDYNTSKKIVEELGYEPEEVKKIARELEIDDSQVVSILAKNNIPQELEEQLVVQSSIDPDDISIKLTKLSEQTSNLIKDEELQKITPNENLEDETGKEVIPAIQINPENLELEVIDALDKILSDHLSFDALNSIIKTQEPKQQILSLSKNISRNISSGLGIKDPLKIKNLVQACGGFLLGAKKSLPNEISNDHLKPVLRQFKDYLKKIMKADIDIQVQEKIKEIKNSNKTPQSEKISIVTDSKDIKKESQIVKCLSEENDPTLSIVKNISQQIKDDISVQGSAIKEDKQLIKKIASENNIDKEEVVKIISDLVDTQEEKNKIVSVSEQIADEIMRFKGTPKKEDREKLIGRLSADRNINKEMLARVIGQQFVEKEKGNLISRQSVEQACAKELQDVVKFTAFSNKKEDEVVIHGAVNENDGKNKPLDLSKISSQEKIAAITKLSEGLNEAALNEVFVNPKSEEGKIFIGDLKKKDIQIRKLQAEINNLKLQKQVEQEVKDITNVTPSDNKAQKESLDDQNILKNNPDENIEEMEISIQSTDDVIKKIEKNEELSSEDADVLQKLISAGHQLTKKYDDLKIKGRDSELKVQILTQETLQAKKDLINLRANAAKEKDRLAQEISSVKEEGEEAKQLVKKLKKQVLQGGMSEKDLARIKDLERSKRSAEMQLGVSKRKINSMTQLLNKKQNDPKVEKALKDYENLRIETKKLNVQKTVLMRKLDEQQRKEKLLERKLKESQIANRKIELENKRSALVQVEPPQTNKEEKEIVKNFGRAVAELKHSHAKIKELEYKLKAAVAKAKSQEKTMSKSSGGGRGNARANLLDRQNKKYKQDVAILNGQLRESKNDITKLKSEISKLKTDIVKMKKDDEKKSA